MDNKTDSSTSEFERRAGAVLRAKADGLSGADRSRLNRARHDALAKFEKPAAASRLRNLLPVSGALLATVIAVAVWFGDVPPGAPGIGATFEGSMPMSESAAPADIDVLTTDESFELLEDLDFYNWLQSVPAGPGHGTV